MNHVWKTLLCVLLAVWPISADRGKDILQKTITGMVPHGTDTIQSLEVKLNGFLSDADQNRHPEKTPLPQMLRMEGFLDLRNSRSRWDTFLSWYGGFRFHYYSVLTPESAYMVSSWRKGYTRPPKQAVASMQENAERLLPLLLIQRLLEQGAGLTTDPMQEGGNSLHKLSITHPGGTRYTLHIRSRDYRVTKLTFQQDDRYHEILYDDYEQVQDLVLPLTISQTINGSPYMDLKVSALRLNQVAADTMFRISADLPNTADQFQPEVIPVSKRAVVLKNAAPLYNVLIADLGSSLLVVDAPESPEVGTKIIQKAKEIFLGKQVDYLVLTHYHADHSGGVRSFVQNGTTIVTTRGNEQYIKKLAGTELVKFQFVEDTIRIGTESVEIYSIGPTPHVDEMLVVYIPSEQLVFNGDLFSRIVPVNETMQFFSGYLQNRAVFPVRTVAGTHHDPISFDVFCKYIEAVPVVESIFGE